MPNLPNRQMLQDFPADHEIVPRHGHQSTLREVHVQRVARVCPYGFIEPVRGHAECAQQRHQMPRPAADIGHIPRLEHVLDELGMLPLDRLSTLKVVRSDWCPRLRGGWLRLRKLFK